jgi:hypothetical protein
VKTYAMIVAGTLTFVPVHSPEYGVWDYPLPISLDDPYVLTEIAAACETFGVSISQVKAVLAQADKDMEAAMRREE